MLCSRRIALLAPLAVLCATSAWGATFSINPMSFRLTPERSSAVMQVTNNGIEPVRLQVQVMAWGTDGKNEILTETDQIMINPPLFTLETKQTQYIRFGAREVGLETVERSYRILLDEVPETGSQRGGIHTLLRISSPIFIPPAVSEEKIEWSLRRSAAGPVLVAANRGNCHLKITALKLLPKNTSTVLFNTGLTYVLPGQIREWSLAKDIPLLPELQLQLQTPAGNHEQTLAFSPF
ncbi:MAG: fimbria/pilus periplasmic chaperone [Pseudomonadota bacterium]